MAHAEGAFAECEHLFHQTLGAQNSGDPILFIHGVSADSETFGPVAEALAKEHKVVLYDLRGHGRSEDPEEGYDLATMVEDLRGLIRSQGFSRVRLVGHSAGAKIAMLLATQSPELVSALVIEDSGISALSANFSAEARARNSRQAKYLRTLKHKTYRSLEELTQDLLPATEGDRKEAEEMAAKIFPVGPRLSAVIMELWADFKISDTSAVLQNYRGQTLFLRAEPGTRYFVEEDVVKIKSQMPNARIVAIPDGTHSIHKKQPSLWLKAVREFLTKP